MVSHWISTKNSGRVAKEGHHGHFQRFSWQPLQKQEHEQHIHLSNYKKEMLHHNRIL